jgi:quinolinate synthase
MEALVAGRVVNQIKVDEQVAKQAKVALERMLALP